MAESSDALRTGIAVVGLAGRFPGAPDVDTFWSNLRAGVESITRLDADQLAAAGVSPETAAAPGFVPAGGTFAGVPEFDAGLFGFSPHDAAVLDPQHRHFLECSWTALEHAGHRPDAFDGVIGVFAGSGVNSYLWTNVLANAEARSTGIFLLRHTGNDKDFLPKRVSYCLGLTGPSVAIQTACSTSLVAIHAACQSLLLGECDMALAGGVTIELPNGAGYLYEEGGILSPDGHCRAFDADAAGTVLGSAVGVVVLRRLADAIDDGDTIHAVIRGSAINNDGALKVGYLAPSIEGQAQAVAVALAMADVDADTIEYVEAHGTGTPVGDPIEVAALTRAFRSYTQRRDFCALGSVKCNIGHTDTAAGVSSFIKAVLALEHGVIPPTLHFQRPNPLLDLENSPFYVNATAREWPANGTPRRAAVNSLGVGGTNAFVVLEEAPAPALGGPSRPWHILPLSGRSPDVVGRLRTRLADRLEQDPPALADVAWTLAEGRRPMQHRTAVVARDVDEALEALLTAGAAATRATDSGGGDRTVAFLFAGGGAQYAGMGAGLYATEPVYRDAIEDCLSQLDVDIAPAVRAILLPAEGMDTSAEATRPAVALPALFAVQYAQARLWQSLGIRPTAMIGHSMGEYTAACLSGVFSLEDALAVVAKRGRLFETVAEGAMTSVQLNEAALEPLLPAGTSIAAINGSELCVASGHVAAIAELEHRLDAADIGYRRLHIDVAAHSALLDPVLSEFGRFLRTRQLSRPTIPFVSNRTGTWIRPEQAMDPEYWVAHLREPVRFADGLTALLADGKLALLEVGPGRTLATLARMHVAGAERPILTSLPHPDDAADDIEQLARTLGELWTVGAPVDWRAWFAGQQRRRVPLPTYPFEHGSHWIEPDAAPVLASTPRVESQGPPPVADWLRVPEWRRARRLPAESRAAGNWLVFGSRDGFGAAVDAELRNAGVRTWFVEAGPRFRQAEPDAFVIDPSRRDELARLLTTVRDVGSLAGVAYLWPIDHALPGAIDVRGIQAFDRALAIVQALAQTGFDDELDLVIGTTGMQPVGTARVEHPELATLLGITRVVPRELPNVHARCIDIDGCEAGSWQWRRHAQDFVSECLHRTSDRAVAYRLGDRWLPTLTESPLDEPSADASLLRDGGVYLITGGTGGLGLAIAEDLARGRTARLVLVGRTRVPDRDRWDAILASGAPAADLVAALRRIEAAGGAVVTEVADVTDAEALRGVVTRTIERFGALHGVIHAAGTLRDGLLLTKTQEEAHAVLAPKVTGAVALDHALTGVDLDFRVLFSSTSAVAGPAGQIDYAAANAFLDAWAHHVHARDGVPTIALAWGPWRDTGMAARLANNGTRTLSHALFDTIVHRDDGELRAFASLSPETHWMLDEHRTQNGDSVLPGSAYLEIARAAWALAGGEQRLRLRDVSFIAPFAVAAGTCRSLRVRLTAQGPERRFAIAGRDAEDGRWEVHARGTIEPLESGEPGRIELAEIRSRCHAGTDRIDGAPTHPHLRFGHRWESVRTVEYGSDEALLSLALPADLTDDLEAHALHPALVDLATAGAQTLIRGRTDADFYVPGSYGTFVIHGPLPRQLWSHVRYRNSADDRPEIAGFDVVLADTDGVVCAEIRDFLMVRVEASALARRPAAWFDEGDDGPTLRPRLDLSEAIRTEDGVEAFHRVLGRGSTRHVIVTPLDPLAVPASDAPRMGSRAEASNGHQRHTPDLVPLEAALMQHPAIREAAALAHHDRAGERIIAFVAPDPACGATATELRRHVRGLVAPELVPASFVEVSALPRLADGQVDRAALPNPFARADEHAAPETATEILLARVWSELLGLDRIGVHDNFLDIGGHSLLGVRALLRIERETGVRLHPNTLTLQTLRQIAAEIDRAAAGSLAAAS